VIYRPANSATTGERVREVGTEDGDECDGVDAYREACAANAAIAIDAPRVSPIVPSPILFMT